MFAKMAGMTAKKPAKTSTPAALAPARTPAKSPGRPRAAAPVPAYHHGDLKQALLDAAQSILETRGLDGFTLRECARRAGVSHAAPAHHFGDVTGLLTEFAAIGFARMAELMQSYRNRAKPEARAQLRAVGLAYIDFAIRHRAHFQLMFRRDRLDAAQQHLAQASAEAAGHLARTLEAALQESGIQCDRQGLDARMMLAWSGVHGFAALLLEGQLDAWRGSKAPERFAAAAGDRMLAVLERALLSPPPDDAMAAKPARRVRGKA
jgi:AcrR family transcriptional regulator